MALVSFCRYSLCESNEVMRVPPLWAYSSTLEADHKQYLTWQVRSVIIGKHKLRRTKKHYKKSLLNQGGIHLYQKLRSCLKIQISQKIRCQYYAEGVSLKKYLSRPLLSLSAFYPASYVECAGSSMHVYISTASLTDAALYLGYNTGTN